MRAVLACALSIGFFCSSHVTYADAFAKQGLIVNSVERRYLIAMPRDYHRSGRAYPLLLVFHGGGMRPADMARVTGFNALAQDDQAIVVYPEGINRHWADGRGTTSPERDGVDDVAFIGALLNQLEHDLHIDPSRIYATGVSNGAIFAHRLGCEFSDRIAAIAPVVGAIAEPLLSVCKPDRPISVLSIQGTDDSFIPIDGGEVGWKSRIGAGGTVASEEETMRFWAENARCNLKPGLRDIPPSIDDDTSVTRKIFSGCAGGTHVMSIIIYNGGHTWPPKKTNALLRGLLGKSSQNLDASRAIWFFLRAHRFS